MCCVGPYSTCWMLSSATWDRRSSVVQLGSQCVEYDTITRQISLSFYAMVLFHFRALNILNWNIPWFWKNTQHYQNTYYIAKKTHITLLKSISHDHVSYYYMTHTKCYIMWYASNHGIRSKLSHSDIYYGDIVYWWVQSWVIQIYTMAI